MRFKNLVSVIFILFLLLILTFSLIPQVLSLEERQKPDYSVSLKSRNFVPEQVVASVASQSNEVIQKTATTRARAGVMAEPVSKKHVLLQFQDIPTAGEKTLLEEQGVKLLDYIPNYAFLASIPSGKDLGGLKKIRAAVELTTDDKVSSNIKEDKIGEWAVKGNRILLYVQFFKDVNLDSARVIIEAYKGIVYDEVPAINALSGSIEKQMINQLASEDSVEWIQEITPQLSELVDGQRQVMKVNYVQAAPYNLDGSGVKVMVLDGGLIDNTHPDLVNRIFWGESGNMADHATHVAGIIGGSGSLSSSYGGSELQWRGMAPQVSMYSYSYTCTSNCFYNSTSDIPHDVSNALTNHNIDLVSASLGSNVVLNGYSCSWMGDYELSSQLLDNIVSGSLGRKIINIWANGNERQSGAPCGEFSTTSTPATAKNIISVGATNSDNKSMTSFSSWGPTDDGRIKPDIVAPGCENLAYFTSHSSSERNSHINTSIWSTYRTSSSYYPYYGMCGTSMSAPAVSGSVALMLQEMRELRNNISYLPWPSTIKAILVQTAEDLGNPGPDYKFGYGHVDVKKAVDLIIADEIADDNNTLRKNRMIIQEAINNEQGKAYSIDVPAGANELKVTLAWDDPAAPPLTGHDLVNDLDLYLVSPSGASYHAYVLNPASPDAPATTGWNTRDNVEQVRIDYPEAGAWSVRIMGYQVPQGAQDYSLIIPFSYSSSYDFETFPINLDPGWNLVSLPFNPLNNSVKNIIKDLTGQVIVWGYDAGTDSWVSYDTTAPFPWLNTLGYMEYGKAYWMKTASAQTIYAEGSRATSYSLRLSPSWNLIGYNLSINTMPDPIIALSSPIVAWTYITSTDEWKSYDTSAPFPWLNTLTNMTAGKGYWLKSSIEQNWTI